MRRAAQIWPWGADSLILPVPLIQLERRHPWADKRGYFTLQALSLGDAVTRHGRVE